MKEDLPGYGLIAETLNEIIENNQNITQKYNQISKLVGKQGKINERLPLGETTGSWSIYVESVNSLLNDLVKPVKEMSRVVTAIAKGDLTQFIPLESDGRPIKGQFLNTAKIVNNLVSQLGSFASEVISVAQDVGIKGKLGGQAEVTNVSGIWKDLTDSVNTMANNLTGQVRNITEVTTAVAGGDLTKKITVEAKGEILKLGNTINTMVDQLTSFADEVTRVAQEVGTEGKLGGQAKVKGVSGTWKDLTDSVNNMANNLTGQVRNIAEVTTAVANGDLTKKITVEASGEILELRNTINSIFPISKS